MNFKRLGRAFRAARDNLFYKRLARSHRIKRHLTYDFELAIKSMGDHLIAFDPHDKIIGNHLRNDGDWFRDDFRKVVSILKELGLSPQDKTFLDVGANIGTQTVYALIQNDFSQAVSFEPVKNNLMALKTNIAINGLSRRAIIVPKAIGAAPGKLSIVLHDINSGAHKLSATGGDYEVEVSTIDEELSGHGVSPENVGLLWLDVEGHEIDVIRGASSITERQIPLFIEVNSSIYGAKATSDFLNYLERSGYRRAFVFSKSENGTIERRTSEIAPFLPADVLFV
jgi:FkbM family methyltransferase